MERAGYTAELPAPPAGSADASGEQDHEQAAGDFERLVFTAVLAVPVMVLSMVPAWQFDRWQQVCFILATPVATWGAWPFRQRALRGLRHVAATMDTLVSRGVLASFVPHIYLEAAVAVPDRNGNRQVPVSVPVEVTPGTAVVGGAVNSGGPMVVLVVNSLRLRSYNPGRRRTGAPAEPPSSPAAPIAAERGTLRKDRDVLSDR